jgi:RNA polymerase sigma-70 factor, ECF subfamily
MLSPSAEITQLLAGMKAGDAGCRSQFAAAVYGELKRMAGAQMRLERRGHTLQPSALVNELFLRMLGRSGAEWENRAHFFSTAASTMRRILIDHARGRRAKKRDGALQRVELDHGLGFEEDPGSERLIALDSALNALAALDARQARIVELRFFAGLTAEETADAMGVSSRTVKREWAMARAWLHGRINGATP